MGFDFKREASLWITKQVKPAVKEYGLVPGYGKSFVRECGGVIQCIHFHFTRIDLRFSAEIHPTYDHYCGTALYNGIPAEVQQTQRGRFLAQHRPSAYECWDDHLSMCAGDEETAERSRRKAKGTFDILAEYIAKDLLPCFHQINSLDRWHEQIMQALPSQNRPVLENDPAGAYLLGVYDCLHQQYDSGLEKLLKTCAQTAAHVDEMRKRVKDYDLNRLKHNDSGGRAHKFTQMFVEALECHSGARTERFLTAYEHVCQEMRVWHGLQ